MTKNTDYAALSDELEEILATLQNPDVTLNETVRLYERGLELIKLLEKELKTAENKIAKIKLQTEAVSEA